MTLSANDRAALRDLVHRYAARVDDRQFDSIVQLFTAAAELALPEPPAALKPIHFHRGHQAIAEAVAAVAAVARTEHAIIGEVFDLGAATGTARGRIGCIAHHWTQRADEVIGCGLASALRRRVRVGRCAVADQPPGVDDQRDRDADRCADCGRPTRLSCSTDSGVPRAPARIRSKSFVQAGFREARESGRYHPACEATGTAEINIMSDDARDVEPRSSSRAERKRTGTGLGLDARAQRCSRGVLAIVVCVANFALGEVTAGLAAAIVGMLAFGAGLDWIAMDRRRIRQAQREWFATSSGAVTRPSCGCCAVRQGC